MWSKKTIFFIILCVFYNVECARFSKSIRKKKPQMPHFYGYDGRMMPVNMESINSHIAQVLPFPFCPYGMQNFAPYGMPWGNMGLNPRYIESLTQNPQLRNMMKNKFGDVESEEWESEENFEIEKPRKDKVVCELTQACDKIAALCPEVETKNMTDPNEKEQLKSLLRDFVIKYNAIKNKNSKICIKKQEDEDDEELDEMSEEVENCKLEDWRTSDEGKNKRNGKSRLVFIGKSRNNVTINKN